MEEENFGGGGDVKAESWGATARWPLTEILETLE